MESLDQEISRLEKKFSLMCTNCTRTLTNTDFLYSMGLDLPDEFTTHTVEGKGYLWRDEHVTVWAVGFARSIRTPMQVVGYGKTLVEALVHCESRFDREVFCQERERPYRKWDGKTRRYYIEDDGERHYISNPLDFNICP